MDTPICPSVFLLHQGIQLMVNPLPLQVYLVEESEETQSSPLTAGLNGTEVVCFAFNDYKFAQSRCATIIGQEVPKLNNNFHIPPPSR